MSFGWSAGDIAAAIQLANRIYKALDSADGAPRQYREETSFLKELTRTLEPLQSFAELGAYPEYGKEIADRVSFIKEPVENLLREIVKLEPKLGIGSKSAHHRHVLHKLKWHFPISKKVLVLRAQIECHMRVLDTLLQRLTLDIVSTIQRNLPDVLVSVFQERIQPELVRILREIVDSQQQQRNTEVDLSHERYMELLSQIEGLKLVTTRSRDFQVQLEKFLRSNGPASIPILVGSSSSDSSTESRSSHTVPPREETMTNILPDITPTIDQNVARESLREVYYLVLLYLGHFLRNVFLLLSQSTRPSRQLVPTLLAHLNITFLDPIGRPPRILHYETFRDFEYFKFFLRKEFRGLSLVQRGQYLLTKDSNILELDEHNWKCHITPGSTVSMAAVMSKTQKLGDGTSRCPEPECKGTLSTSAFETWAKCPICGKEVLTFGPRSHQVSKAGGGHDDYDDTEVTDQDISLFKRIVRLAGTNPEDFDVRGWDGEDSDYVFPFYKFARPYDLGAFSQVLVREFGL